MARGAGGGIPGNDLGQGSTSPSTFAHVLGVSGAPTGAVGGAADGTDRSTGDTQNMGESAGTGGTLAWVIARDAPSSSPGHGVAHSGRKVTL